MKDYKVYVDDICNNILDIENFTENYDLSSFVKDRKTQNAVIRSFEVIGEASKNIPEHIQIKHPEIPWRILAGFRDRLIHAYFDVNLEIVWESVNQIKELKNKIERLK